MKLFALLLLIAIIAIVIYDLKKIYAGDCVCGGKYYINGYDKQVNRYTCKCNQCGNEVNNL